jgi:hypothetical protein
MPDEFPSIVSQNESVRWRGPTIGLYFHVVTRFDLAPFGAVPFDCTTKYQAPRPYSIFLMV